MTYYAGSNVAYHVMPVRFTSEQCSHYRLDKPKILRMKAKSAQNPVYLSISWACRVLSARVNPSMRNKPGGASRPKTTPDADLRSAAQSAPSMRGDPT
jgi:hypothetical protein